LRLKGQKEDFMPMVPVRQHWRPFVSLLAAGLAIAVGACGGEIVDDGAEPAFPEEMSEQAAEAEIALAQAALTGERKITPAHGGGGGRAFSWRPRFTWKLTRIKFYCDPDTLNGGVNGMEVWWNDTVTGQRFHSGLKGRRVGIVADMAIHPHLGQSVFLAEGHSGRRVNRLQFQFVGRGSDGCGHWRDTFFSDYHGGKSIEGFYGRADSRYLHQIGFYVYSP
jgi:hypothetical protein